MQPKGLRQLKKRSLFSHTTESDKGHKFLMFFVLFYCISKGVLCQVFLAEIHIFFQNM